PAPEDRGGPIGDAGGRELGRHGGVHRYTVGQRRGLGVTSARPLYVLAVLPASRTVVVREAEGLESPGLVARDVDGRSIASPDGALRADVKIRYRAAEAAATLLPLPD